MKGTTFILALLVFLFAHACNQPQKEKSTKEKERKEQQTVDKSESKKITASSKPQEKRFKARFKKYMFTDLGAIYVFVDESGKEWKLCEHGDTEGTGFAGKLKPNSIYPKFDSQWFEVTWDKRKLEFYDAGNDATTNNEKVLILLSAKKIGDEVQKTAEEPAITFEELQNAVFFGTEPFWNIKFRSSQMYYKSGPGAEEELYNYLVEGNSKTPVKAISDNEIQVNVWPAKNGNDSYRWYIKIRKEPCSDGMSENTYPYSVEIKWEDVEENGSGKIGEGCGRITNNLVNIKEIEKTRKIKQYKVSEVMYKPHDEFNISLKGTFDFKGHFTINPMSNMLNFHVDKNERPEIDIKIETFTRPLFASFHFKNEKLVKEALGKETMKKIRNGEKVQAHILFENYEFGGRIDGYGGASAEFVKFVY